MDLRQAGRGQERVDRQLAVHEDLGLAGADVGRADEELDAAAGLELGLVDQPGEHVAQRAPVERVALVGRSPAGKGVEPTATTEAGVVGKRRVRTLRTGW